MTNNYIEGVREGGFRLTAGMVDPKPVEYVEARDCVIAFNTFVESRGPAIDLSAGLSASTRRRLVPRDNAVANNVFVLTEGPLLSGTEGEAYRWAGNVAFAPGVTTPVKREGIRWIDPGLQRGTDGLLRPTKEGPLRDAAAEVAKVERDLDGQPRGERSDAGCDELSDAPVTNRPLTAGDVGPGWMKQDSQ